MVQEGGPELLCDISTGHPCPIVPAYWRHRVFNIVQSLTDPGVQASVKLVGSKFVWPGLCKEVREWAAACVACQRAKVHWHTKALLDSHQNFKTRACGPGGPFAPFPGVD